MSSYTTGKFLDEYDKNNTELDLYDMIQYEEFEYYQDDYDGFIHYFPKKLCVFMDNTFYNSYTRTEYYDVLKFLKLYHNHISNDVLYTNQIAYGEYYYYLIDCIEAFIDSRFGQLPFELIAYILIGYKNYIEF